MKPSILRRARVLFMGASILVTGSLFGAGCSLEALRDSAWEGVLSAVEGAGANLVDGLIINFNEFFESTPDNSIDTP